MVIHHTGKKTAQRNENQAGEILVSNKVLHKQIAVLFSSMITKSAVFSRSALLSSKARLRMSILVLSKSMSSFSCHVMNLKYKILTEKTASI